MCIRDRDICGMQKAGGVTAETGGKGKDGRNMQRQISRVKMLQRQILPERRSLFGKRGRTIIGTGLLLTAIAAVGGFFAVTGEIGALAAGGSVLVLAAVWTAVMYFLEKKELEGFMADIGRLLDTMEGPFQKKGHPSNRLCLSPYSGDSVSRHSC